jgi:hypothetical protein
VTPQAERLQHLEADLDLLDRVGRQRHPDRVADPRPQQHAEPDRGLDRAAAQTARFGDTEMKRIVAGLGKLLIGGHREKHVGCLARDLELEEVVVLEDLGMVKRAFDHRLGAWFSVALEEIAFERDGINADPHRAAVILCRLDHLADARRGADVAGIDTQARRTTLRRFDRALVMEVDVGDDRHRHLSDDLLQSQCGLLVGAGNSNDVRTGSLERPDLRDRRRYVTRFGVGHRLHRDWCIAADRYLADMDLAALTAVDVAIGPDAHSATLAQLIPCKRLIDRFGTRGQSKLNSSAGCRPGY